MSQISLITPQFLQRHPLPSPGEGDKKTRGDVLIIAGSSEVPGGALLAGVAALRAGAGRLQIATCACNATPLAIAVPEALVIALAETSEGTIEPSAAVDKLSKRLTQIDAVLIGPGLGDEDSISRLVVGILKNASRGTSFVLDAGAIKHLRSLNSVLTAHKGNVVVTPHAGEMAGLMKISKTKVQADPIRIAAEAADELQAVIALKGARTFVASSRNELAVCEDGNVGLATSGSGDVLAGIIAGLLARGTPAFAATCWGVYLHAKAGDRLAQKMGPLGYLARELLSEIPTLLPSPQI